MLTTYRPCEKCGGEIPAEVLGRPLFRHLNQDYCIARLMAQLDASRAQVAVLRAACEAALLHISMANADIDQPLEAISADAQMMLVLKTALAATAAPGETERRPE